MSDGSERYPFSTIDSALGIAAGRPVAIAPGIYPEALGIDASARLVGACTEGVILQRTGRLNATIRIANGASVEIARLTIRGGSHGVQVQPGSSANLSEVSIENPSIFGLHALGVGATIFAIDVLIRGASRGISVSDGASVEVMNSALDGNTTGISVEGNGANVLVTRSVIRFSGAVSGAVRGVLAGDRSRVEIRESAMIGNGVSETGDASLVLDAVNIRGRVSPLEYLVSISAGTATISNAWLDDCQVAGGILALGTRSRVNVSDSVVQRLSGLSSRGRAFIASGGARLAIQRSAVVGNVGALQVSGSTISFDRSLIDGNGTGAVVFAGGTLTSQGSAFFRSGTSNVWVTGAGSVFRAQDSVLSSSLNSFSCLSVEDGGEASLERTVAQNSSAFGIDVRGIGTVDLESSLVRGNNSGGISALPDRTGSSGVRVSLMLSGVVSNRNIGVGVQDGIVDIQDSIISGTMPVLGFFGYGNGIAVMNSTLTLQRSSLIGNSAVAVLGVGDSVASIYETYVSDTSEYGELIKDNPQAGYAVGFTDTSSVQIRRSTFERNGVGVGLTLAATSTIEDVLISQSRFGGILVSGDASVRRILIDRTNNLAVVVNSDLPNIPTGMRPGRLHAEYVLIRDMGALQSVPGLEGIYGVGLSVFNGGGAWMKNLWIRRSQLAGIAVRFPTSFVELDNVLVEGTTTGNDRTLAGGFGDGIIVYDGAEGSITRAWLVGNVRAGLAVASGAARLTASRVSRNVTGVAAVAGSRFGIEVIVDPSTMVSDNLVNYDSDSAFTLPVIEDL